MPVTEESAVSGLSDTQQGRIFLPRRFQFMGVMSKVAVRVQHREKLAFCVEDLNAKGFIWPLIRS